MVPFDQWFSDAILHESQNTPGPYPTMHDFVTEMCICVHISVTKWCIVGYKSDALWDLCDGSIHDDGHGMDALCTSLALCAWKPPITGGFQAQRASNVEI